VHFWGFCGLTVNGLQLSFSSWKKEIYELLRVMCNSTPPPYLLKISFACRTEINEKENSYEYSRGSSGVICQFDVVPLK